MGSRLRRESRARSSGLRSFSHVTRGTGLPLAEHSMTVARPRSTAFNVGLSTIRGKPGGTKRTHTHTCTHTHTDTTQYNYYYYYYPFNGLFSRTTWVSRYQKGKTSLDLNEARDDGVLGCSGISWTICKQSAPRSRQTTTPTPHCSMFTGRMLFLMPYQNHINTCSGAWA